VENSSLSVIEQGALTPKQPPLWWAAAPLPMPPLALLQCEYLFIPASLLSSLFSLAYLWLLPFSSWPLQPELGHYAQLVVEAINL